MTPDERGAIVRAAAHVCTAPRSSRPRSGAGRSRAPSTVHESRRCPEHHLTPVNRFEDVVHRTHTNALIKLATNWKGTNDKFRLSISLVNLVMIFDSSPVN